jgi:hypothetical protein
VIWMSAWGSMFVIAHLACLSPCPVGSSSSRWRCRF